jgi:hypothetical protein
MKENKLTPEEIKKGLECCGSPEGDSCFYCPFSGSPLEYCTTKLHTEAVALINRQQAEIEALNHYYNECLKDLKNAHAEIERLQNDLAISRKETKRKHLGVANWNWDKVFLTKSEAEQKLKEMRGGNDL